MSSLYIFSSNNAVILSTPSLQGSGPEVFSTKMGRVRTPSGISVMFDIEQDITRADYSNPHTDTDWERFFYLYERSILCLYSVTLLYFLFQGSFKKSLILAALALGNSGLLVALLCSIAVIWNNFQDLLSKACSTIKPSPMTERNNVKTTNILF